MVAGAGSPRAAGAAHRRAGHRQQHVDLFKDTSLVTIIGPSTCSGRSINRPRILPGWVSPGRATSSRPSPLCPLFGMSSYSCRFERRLKRHRTGER
jgi:general L-amino acid transport system permease protein